MSAKVPDGLKYSKEHEWVKTDGNVATIGITDHAQHALGDIVFVELPKLGTEAKFMKPVGVVESVKAASDIFSPVSGKVVAINTDLAKTPEAINTDCYGAGWMVKIELSAPDELNKLLDAKSYTEFLGTL
ncbi:MAG TPA: glycine cleavage system protein GcvH [Planctomycetota bacterium]|nr:glycine cleavage system protein GcvH [Planctomycetota bacterium]